MGHATEETIALLDYSHPAKRSRLDLAYLVGSVVATFSVVLQISNLGGWFAVRLLPSQVVQASAQIQSLTQIHWMSVLFSLPSVGLLVAIACTLAGLPVGSWVVRLLAGVVVAECVVWRTMYEFTAGNSIGDVLPMFGTPMMLLLGAMVVVPPTRFGDDGRSHYLLRMCGLFSAFITASRFAMAMFGEVVFSRIPLWQRLDEVSIQMRSSPVLSSAPILMLVGCMWMVFRPSRACGWAIVASLAAITLSHGNLVRSIYQGNWQGWLFMVYASIDSLFALLPVLLLPLTVTDRSRSAH